MREFSGFDTELYGPEIRVSATSKAKIAGLAAIIALAGALAFTYRQLRYK